MGARMDRWRQEERAGAGVNEYEVFCESIIHDDDWGVGLILV